MTVDVRSLGRIAAIVLGSIVAACSPLSDTIDSSGVEFKSHQTAHFDILYSDVDNETVDSLGADMEEKLARLMGVLKVDTMPQITAVLYPDRYSFARANNTDYWVTGITRGRTRMEMVSPDGPNQVFDLWPDTRAEHLIAHLVSLGVNPSAGNNPRWLWESIALYESRQFIHPRAYSFFAPGETHTLSELNGGYGTPILDVGYFLGEFIVDQWGTQGFIDLLKAGGNIPDALGIDGTQFMAQFIAHVREKYNLPS